jgi:hypothetical protein
MTEEAIEGASRDAEETPHSINTDACAVAFAVMLREKAQNPIPPGTSLPYRKPKIQQLATDPEQSCYRVAFHCLTILLLSLESHS